VTPLDAAAIAAAGVAAGIINTVVGSGSLITFPTLLAVGYPAKIANVSNTIGLVSGSVSGAVGYRRELAGQRRRVLSLVPASLLGGVAGALLLLLLPGSVFRRVVPVLILLAVVLVLVQPRVAARRAERGHVREHPGALLYVGSFATAIYGGYFGAAQSVMYLALLAICLDDDLQRLNGVKNVITAVVNATAAVLFMATTHVAWDVVGILFVTSSVGGQLGAVLGRRIPPDALRALIAVVGTAVAVKLLVTG
jgi:uncharacterized membrane protein YfcA